MISLFKYISNKLFDNSIKNSNENEDDKIEDGNVENLLIKINEIRETNTTNVEESNLNLTHNDQGCFYKSGIITLVNNDYVLIEHKYVCETKYIIPTNLRKGDKVYYMAYNFGMNEELKVHKIISKFNVSWDTEDQSESCGNEQNRNKINKTININETYKDQILKKRQINERTIIGKVDKRKGREICLDDSTLINLDNISSTFVPVIGDWIKLDCLVEVNENISNLKGEILEIKSMLPLRQLSKLGMVTEYNDTLGYGIIEKIILFSKSVCTSGYIPSIGDKVVVQSIESDQGIQYHWRALTVVPFDVSNRLSKSVTKFNHKLSEDLNELIKNKENINISNKINVTLDAKMEKQIEITIKNNGDCKQNIHKCLFVSKESQSQLTLISPKNEIQDLKPLDEIIYKFICKARFVGNFEELVIFNFGHFKIGRIFQIKVNSLNLKKQILKENISNTFNNIEIPKDFEEGSYIKGVKPYKSAKFIPIRPVTWKIPQILWSTINEIMIEKMTNSESEFALLRKIPCFEQQLCFQNYKQRFDYLLYLEEIAQILNIQKFNMHSAVLHHSGEYLSLNVPSLTEKRPSLLIGDKIIVSFKWASGNEKLNYEGYIHKIKSSNIFLKFNKDFHNIYRGQDCQINFKVSTNVFQRCHAAIGVVINKLGAEFLFPTKVVQNKTQYNFIENDEIEYDKLFLNKLQKVNAQDINMKKIKMVEELLYKKKLNWFNKKLNVYQKEAIKNILKGLARPLPYIIFGPPGTGKTITVCETILQILFTISESRILIATPSNSSANLITERLLDGKLLKPGDLVRLVGYNYLESESIPEKLLPYCATASISNEYQQFNQNIFNPRGCKSNITLRVLCRHRIIIGTCSAVGILYNMGCKPGHFTHIIVDEAGQPSEPEIMIPLSLAHINKTQVVLAGDPEQLGPINQSRLASSFGLSDSFLVRLLQQFPYQRDPVGFESGYDPRLITKLLLNYRSLPDLLELPNKLFYESELISQVNAENSNEAELLKSLSDILPRRLGNPPTVIFHNVNGKNLQDQDSPSWYNPEEATQVYIYLLDLYNHGLKSNDIGIITPYSKQVSRIRSLLAELEIEIPKVGSVEEFQGQERKVIILSVVRTAEDKVKEDMKHALGFISARERLNVAITRARTLLIIIGNSNLLKEDFYWQRILDHCLSQNSYIDIYSHY